MVLIMKIDNNHVDGFLSSAVNWLLFSEIQQTDKNCYDYGGFRAWIVSDSKEYSYTYPEITGYALSLLSILYQDKNYNDKQILLSLQAAQQYLIKNCLNDELGNFALQDISNGTPGRTYTFDVGIILKGLLHSNEILKDSKVTDICIQLANWIMHMKNENGMFYTFHDRVLNKKAYSQERWSLQSGSFLYKLAIPFVELYKIESDVKYLQCMYDCLDIVLQKQDESGRFITDKIENSTFLHAHCYTLEGLLAIKAVRDDVYVNSAIERGIAWLVEVYSKHRYIPSVVYENGCVLNEQRSDIVAQVLLLISVNGNNDKIKEELLNILYAFQAKWGDQCKGGLYFHNVTDNKSMPNKQNHINTWSTIAAIHSLIKINSSFQMLMNFFV